MDYKRPFDETIWRGLHGYCISCGYLGKRSHIFPEVYEATEFDRTYLNFVTNNLPPPHYPATWPCCFVNELPLSKEFKDLEEKYQGTKDNARISFDITTRDIKCPQWTPYKDFRTPKEHFEEFNMLQLEQRREEFEQRIERERKEFEMKLEECNRKEQRKTNTIMVWLTIAAVIFAALQVYAALASINPNHWLFRWLC